MVRFLVAKGITSISLNPDAVMRGLETIAAAEADLHAPSRSSGGEGPDIRIDG